MKTRLMPVASLLWMLFLVACGGSAATPTAIPPTATTAPATSAPVASPTAATEAPTPTIITETTVEEETPPNTALESAIPLTETVTGIGSDTTLYYSLPITAGDMVSATIATADSATGGTLLELYAKEGTYIRGVSAEPGENAALTYIFDHNYTGVALLRVTGSGEFTLSGTATPQDDAELGMDTGDQLDSANSLALGDEVVGLLGDADLADAYTFNLPESGGYLSITVASGAGSIDASLYDATPDYLGGLTLEASQTAEIPYTLSADSGGDWLLIISSHEVTTYTVNVSFMPQDEGTSGGDAGAEIESATVAEVGELNGILGNSDTSDVYQFTLPATGAIFRMDLQNAGAEYSAELHNEDGEFVGSVTAGSDPATFTYLYPDGSGEMWYVIVSGNDSSTYTLTTSVTAQNDGDSGMDAGVEATVAVPVTVGEITGMIGFDDNNDYFALPLTEGATLTITLTSESDTALAIYDSTGNYVNTLIATAAEPTATLQIPIDSSVSNPYYLDVSKGDGIAAYTITTEIGDE